MLFFCQSYAASHDSYDGWLELKGKKTGFFHTEQIQGRWWLISPEGNAFFSKGVDHVDLTPESGSAPKAPDDPAAWAKTTAEQLRGWNFNTLGAWSSPQLYTAGLAYAPMVDVAASAGRDVWLKGGVIDYFSPGFQQAADRAAQRICAPRAKDPRVLGYFTDNELRWGADWRGTDSLLEQYPEFSFKAMDSGLPNTRGAAKPVATQEDRAKGFAGYVGALAALPGCVGYHWFQYRDQPKEGRRLDGENSNYGVVKIDGSPWETLTTRMKQVNAELEALHARAQVR